jgi:iron complex transport system ATP-binding protein
MADLILDSLSVTVGGKTLLHPLSAALPPGRIVAVVGANGAGKSTLLRAIAALVPAGGSARLDDQTLATLSPSARARMLAYLPQSHDAAWSMPVRDMVALGRYAYGEPARSPEVSAAVDAVLVQCGIADLADRPIDRLSGGEQAMAALARVLVTGCPLLLLDEPVAALDIGRQYQLLEQLSTLAATGRTLMIILHDLALVSQFADRILWLDQGRLVADTANSRAAIDTHAAPLLGRAPSWTHDAGTRTGLFFSRE